MVDVKRTALHAEGSRLIGKAMLAIIRSVWPETTAVGGRELGAVPLATSVSLMSLEDGGTDLDAFIVRKTPKGHGTGQLIEASADLGASPSVVVLEDVSTTGGSSLAAVQAARDEGYEVLGALTVVDRDEGARELFAAEGLELHSVFTRRDFLNE